MTLFRDMDPMPLMEPSFDIVLWPNPILKQKCEPIAEVTDAVRWLLGKMVETMKTERGLGLAAPQVGRLLRACVVWDDSINANVKLVNPIIVELSHEKRLMREGCLSVPGYFENVLRSERVVVEGLDHNGAPFRMIATGRTAQALQHEIEHLDGLVFVDQLSALKQSFARKAMKKNLELQSSCPKEYEQEGMARASRRGSV